MTNRKVKEKVRTFEHFPETSICPICKTNDDGETILVAIDGTESDGNVQATVLHLSCAVVKQHNKDINVFYIKGDTTG